MTDHCEKYLLRWTATIGDAIKLLDSNGGLICILVDAREEIVGTITDGDIRRDDEGISLQSTVDDISQKNFISTVEPANRDVSNALMKK